MSENGTTPTPSLHRKLAEIMGAVGRIEKRGHNSFHGYNYATEADVAEAVRKEFSERHLTMIASVEKLEIQSVGREGKSDKYITHAWINYTITDADSGEFEKFTLVGAGEDSGEKGIYKAYTGAQKYALMKMFMIPTGDDPENDSQEKGKAGAAQGAPRSTPSTGASDRPACPKCGKSEWVLADRDTPGSFFCWQNAAKKKLGCGQKWSTSGANGAASEPTQEPARAGAAKPSGNSPPDFKARFLAIAAANAYRKPETQLRLANGIRKTINLEPLETLDAPDIAWEAMCVALEARAEFKKPGGAGAAGTSSAGNVEPVSAEVH